LFTAGSTTYRVLGWQPVFSNSTASIQRIAADTTVLVKVLAQSTDGCLATDSLLLIVDPLTDVYIPNAFTPNSDGKNDYFIVGGGHFSQFRLQIYNRWGQLVFSSNERSKGWDGTLAGKPQPSASYVYFLNATLKDGKPVKRSGTITLIR